MKVWSVRFQNAPGASSRSNISAKVAGEGRAANTPEFSRPKSARHS